MEIRRDGIRILKNPQRKERPKAVFTEEKAQEALRFHRSLPAYGETALRSLDALAKSLRLGGIFVKDESSRFGLNAFKGLGGSYALFRLLCERFGLDPRKTNFADLLQEPYRTKCRAVEFTTATDGNHGRRLLGGRPFRLPGARFHAGGQCGSTPPGDRGSRF